MNKLACALTISSLLGLPAAGLAQEQKKVQTPKSGCRTCELAGTDASPKARLTIRWKRLVLGKDKKTAPQHAATEQAVDRAFATLYKSLAPLGVEVSLQKAEVSEASFQKDPTCSNRLWINGASLEMYLPKARAGKAVDKKSGTTFRTLEFAGKSFRDIPADMIVQAGLIAAGDSVKQALAEVQVTAGAGCCDEAKAKKSGCCDEAKEKKSGCCQEPAKK